MAQLRTESSDGRERDLTDETKISLDIDTIEEVTFEVYTLLAKAMREGYGSATITIELRE